jgi:prepilin-type N-terminal cleavage/methylation domain-containing protein
MQTSLSSHRISYRSKGEGRETPRSVGCPSLLSRFRETVTLEGGFTLIELLISAAIITAVTAIVLVRFNSFDGTVLLKSMAYEVATSVREAQIYSVSVVNAFGGGGQTFRYPYGLHFLSGATSYTFFRFDDDDKDVTPSFTIGPSSPLRVMTLGNSMEIFRICVVMNGTDDCSIGELDISFRRPEFSAIFYTPDLTGAELSEVSAAKVYVRSTRNSSNVWIVEVKLLGQISTYACTTNCS